MDNSSNSDSTTTPPIPLQPKQVKKNGRPSSYTEEKGVTICNLMATGNSLRKICKMEGMPDLSTVMRWLYHEPSFSIQYARAREERCLTFAEDILELGDNVGLTNEEINKAKLQIDARKWLAVKYLPKVFGEKQEIEHLGS